MENKEDHTEELLLEAPVLTFAKQWNEVVQPVFERARSKFKAHYEKYGDLTYSEALLKVVESGFVPSNNMPLYATYRFSILNKIEKEQFIVELFNNEDNLLLKQEFLYIHDNAPIEWRDYLNDLFCELVTDKNKYKLFLPALYAYLEKLIREFTSMTVEECGWKLINQTKEKIKEGESVNNSMVEELLAVLEQIKPGYFSSIKDFSGRNQEVNRNTVLHGITAPTHWTYPEFLKTLSLISFLTIFVKAES